MASNQYLEKLKDPRWQKKRLEIFERDGWECTNCGNKDETLHVHHTYYLSGREPWEYPDGSLKTRCEMCHKDGHAPHVSIPSLMHELTLVGIDSEHFLQPFVYLIGEWLKVRKGVPLRNEDAEAFETCSSVLVDLLYWQGPVATLDHLSKIEKEILQQPTEPISGSVADGGVSNA